MRFPIDLSAYQPLSFALEQETLPAPMEAQLQRNVQLVRDSIVFFTAFANTKGLGGHSGGPYDMVPEVLIVDGFIKGNVPLVPIYFDEAGHRVALQYAMAALNGYLQPEDLLHYREFDRGLYGHPERDPERGVFFSSGRLGHLWSYVNGVAKAHPDKTLVLFGSDGSQQEGGDAEAARFAVAQKLNVKVIVDDNDVTIAGHPSEYMRGFDVAQTLMGHGLPVDIGDGEDLGALYQRIRQALMVSGPSAVINKRKMAVGIPEIEGTPKGHDVIPVSAALAYLKARDLQEAVKMLEDSAKPSGGSTFLGSTAEKSKNRDSFGKIICELVKDIPDVKEKFLVVDSDLEGSCGLHHIRKNIPEIYVAGGIMERNNYSVAAGFGSEGNRQGIFGTFAAFMEMVISEITMARLNRANVLAHFSHSGVDDMADNTCHFGINNFFADNGLAEGDNTQLVYPADGNQLHAVLKTILTDPGLRFVFSTRSAVPTILDTEGNPFFGADYQYVPGRDDVIRDGSQGYVVTYGEMLYRCLDVVERLKEEGIDIGLVNKPCLNRIDEAMMTRLGQAPFVLVVETQNIKTGLGVRLGSWMLERGLHPRYSYMGSVREGHGGLVEQIPYQGMGQEAIAERIKTMLV